MNLRKSAVVLMAIASTGGCLRAGPSDDKEMAAPTVATVSDPFYAELYGGAVFLNTPKKNNENLYTDVGAIGLNGRNNATGNFDTDSIGGSLGGTFGYVLEVHPNAGWLGDNLRVEGNVNYFAAGTQAKGSYASSVGNPDNAFWIQALDGSGGNFIGVFQGARSVNETTSDYFYQGGAAVKSDFSFMNGKLVLTPTVGLDYSHLGQHFDTSASGSTGFFDQQERVDTDYYGFNFGLAVSTKITRRLSASFSGAIAPIIASSSYHGHQFVDGGVGISDNEANDNTTLLTFRATAEGSLCYDLGPVIFKLSGGVQYWNYAATIAESALPLGSEVAAPGGGSSHLASGSMLNPEVNGAVVFPF